MVMMGMIDNIKGDDNYTFILSADDNSEENDSVVDKIGHDFDLKYKGCDLQHNKLFQYNQQWFWFSLINSFRTIDSSRTIDNGKDFSLTLLAQ